MKGHSIGYVNSNALSAYRRLDFTTSKLWVLTILVNNESDLAMCLESEVNIYVRFYKIGKFHEA